MAISQEGETHCLAGRTVRLETRPFGESRTEFRLFEGNTDHQVATLLNHGPLIRKARASIRKKIEACRLCVGHSGNECTVRVLPHEFEIDIDS